MSRIGEVAMNAFIDAYEHQGLNTEKEQAPMFHEWATVQPGMVCLARKKRTAQYRQFHAAETAMPVIGCGSCLKLEDEKNFFFGKMLCHNVARCSYRMLTTCPVPVSQLACADRKACAPPTTASGRRPTSSSLLALAAW